MEKVKNSLLTPALRFEATRIVLRLSKGRLCKELDTSMHIYKNVLAGKTKLPAEWVSYMEQQYRVSYNWVLLGRGDIFIPRLPQ